MVSPTTPGGPQSVLIETSTQLIAERRIPIPAHRGRRERFDYEYRRNGTRNLFMLCEPLEACGGHRATEDGGLCLPDAVAGYTKAERIRVVLDNLNACIVVCPGGGKEDTEAWSSTTPQSMA